MAEHGYAVTPRTTLQIAEAAEALLRRLAPGHLDACSTLDLAPLVDVGLQEEGILVYPVADGELPMAEAETRAGDDGWIEILMRQQFFDALFAQTPQTNRARSTLVHEVGHAALHPEEVRMGKHRPEEMVLRRALRSNLRPYEDSEWQAHTFAGAILIPRPSLRACLPCSHADLAERFGVSAAFARSHLKRVNRVL